MLITKSCEDDVSVNNVINDLLKQALEDDTIFITRKDSEIYPTEEDLNQAKKELLLEKDYLYNANVNPDSTNNDTSICNNTI
jgi:hypothetical protein